MWGYSSLHTFTVCEGKTGFLYFCFCIQEPFASLLLHFTDVSCERYWLSLGCHSGACKVLLPLAGWRRAVFYARLQISVALAWRWLSRSLYPGVLLVRWLSRSLYPGVLLVRWLSRSLYHGVLLVRCLSRSLYPGVFRVRWLSRSLYPDALLSRCNWVFHTMIKRININAAGNWSWKWIFYQMHNYISWEQKFSYVINM